ncbi:thiamine pyrophosphate-binding protein [Brevibacillus ruminantium]|uniref:Thiamine pyrophosphate-binding protein n=1 Tax=Brevibacillus ruminantium TaxID=2950604 RepID=A0ABY4WPM5_9BACL|nr:thiamine pyrophosphate-binding protein [Brevibacillus ruminantium]USG66596.1 thiamine pyrophosphate-binding protein [Brevibacillus ruminantium]
MSQISVYEGIAKGLKAFGTEVVFGLPNDELLLMHAIENQDIEFMVTKDQRNAVFMATGYALAAQKLGVCVVGKGPAVSNTITGLLEAHAQSCPLLILSSGTSTGSYGKKKAFQEADQMALVSPLVKWSHRLESKESLGWVLRKAVFLATQGTPGPVYIEIPENIGSQQLSGDFPDFSPLTISKTMPDPLSFRFACEKISHAAKPILLLGGGCKWMERRGVLEMWAEQLGALVLVTASGRGSFHEEHPLYGGLAGLYVHRRVKTLLQEADLVITLGSKLEETALFGWEEQLQTKEIIQVNINEEHFHLDYPSLCLIGDVECVVNEMLAHTKNRAPHLEWVREIEQCKQAMLLDKAESKHGESRLRVADLLKELQACLPANSIYVHENGLQDMWSYFFPYLGLAQEQNAYVPSEQTSLGFGACAAIGVAKAKPLQPVVAFVGDGAFNLFRSDLSTALAYEMPLIYVVLQNGGYGWLDFQHVNTGRKEGSRFLHPHFSCTESRHPKLTVIPLHKREECKQVIEQAWREYERKQVVVIEAMVSVDDVPEPLTKLHGDFPVKELM